MGRLLKHSYSVAKKGLFMVVIYTVIITLFAYFTTNKKAEHIPDPYVSQQSQIYKMIKDPQLNSTKEGVVSIALYRALMCNAIGEVCTDNPKDADKNFANSWVGHMTNLMAVPYTHPPASFAYWVGNGLQNTGFIPKTYAYEGVGFASIKGYRSIWNIFRNLSYLVLVFVIVTVGFMIMFRMKINAQTIVSIENALPHIVMALIYITFSFAIAGLLIDAMYLLIGIIVSILSQLNVGNLKPDALHVGELINEYFAAGFAGIWPYDAVLVNGNMEPLANVVEVATGPGGPAIKTGFAFFNILPSIIQIPIKGVIAFVIGNSLKGMVMSHLKDFFGAFRGLGILGNNIGHILDLIPVALGFIVFVLIVSWLPGFILGLCILLTIFLLLARIFFLLLKSYISITLLIIFSPIILLLEAIPGRNSFKNWILSLIGELLTFPLVILFTLVGYAIVSINHTSQIFTLPFLYGFSSDDISTIIGMGIILMIPNLVELIKKSTGAKGLPLDFGFNTFFEGGALLAGRGTGSVAGYGSLLRGMRPQIKQFTQGKGMWGTIGSTAFDVATQQGLFTNTRKESEEIAKQVAKTINAAADSK